MIGLHDKSYNIRGDDSLQALVLCVRFMESLLKNAIADGVKFYYEDGSEMDPL
jgi:hypothetical protein